MTHPETRHVSRAAGGCTVHLSPFISSRHFLRKTSHHIQGGRRTVLLCFWTLRRCNGGALGLITGVFCGYFVAGRPTTAQFRVEWLVVGVNQPWRAPVRLHVPLLDSELSQSLDAHLFESQLVPVLQPRWKLYFQTFSCGVHLQDTASTQS